MQEKRLFRPPTEILAINPEAVTFSYLYTGTLPTYRTADGIAVVTINGPLEHHATKFWDSYEAVLERVESAMSGSFETDQAVLDAIALYGTVPDDYEIPNPTPARAVVLCIDSPGGEAAGSMGCHRRLRALRKRYNCPLYAYANETAASAAYAIASACDEIWLPDTGTVGSIGVIATMFDRTKQNAKSGLLIELITSGEQKADGHADRVLTDDIRGRMQQRVYDLASVFWDAVAKARNTTPKAIAGLQAGVFVGQRAVDVGIADGVCNWNKFLKIVRSALNAPELAATTAA